MKFKKSLNTIGILLGLIALIFIPVKQGYALNHREGSPYLKEIRELHQEIILYNLINGLNLDQEQIENLLLVLKEVDKKKESHRQKIEQQVDAMRESLLQLKERLENEEEVDPELAKSVRKKSHLMREERFSFLKELKSYEEQVKNILNPNQVYMIEKFKPCLVLSGESFIGQAEHREAPSLRLLSRIREMDKDDFEWKKERILQRHIWHLEDRIGPMSDEEKEAEKERIEKILTEIRSLSELEFEMKKEELGKKLIEPLGESQRKALRMKKRRGDEKMVRLFFNPTMIKILEKKLESFRNDSK